MIITFDDSFSVTNQLDERADFAPMVDSEEGGGDGGVPTRVRRRRRLLAAYLSAIGAVK